MKNTVFFILSFISITTAMAQTTSLQEPLVHTVLFYLHEPDNPAHREEFEAAIHALIANNPQGVQSFLGTPATTEARGVVQSDYTYLYLMTFRSVADEAAYQTDPTHLAFIERAKHLWKKVVVFDALEQDEK